MSIEVEKEYWDKAAADPNVEEKYIADVDLKECLLQIQPYLRKYSILEIGCGIGRLTTALAKEMPDCQLHGIDISSKMLDLAPKSSVKYRVTNGRKIPYAEKSFDSIYSMLVFQHIPDSAKAGYIKEAAYTLKKGGAFIVQYVEGNHHADIDHNTTEENMTFWLEDNNFRIRAVNKGRVHPQWNWIVGEKL